MTRMNRIDLPLAFTIISQNIISISKYDLVVFQCLGAMRLYKRESKRNNIKKAQWMEAKDIECMKEMKEKLRDLSIHVLPNIEENDQEDALPLPSPTVVQE
jgi:hypothetical protein